MTKLPTDEIIARIEASLYSAGRPLTIDEIVKASGTESRVRVKRLLNELINKTKVAFKALEISNLEDGTYVFHLKPSYAPIIKKFSNKPQISNSVMKTLSYVAYEQPVTSKRLVEIRDTKVYNHLKELQDLEFISHNNSGRVKVYNTTSKFKNYFGISDIAMLKKSLLLNPREVAKKNT